MGSNDRALLAVLQLADSGFPSGAYVLSHGLEMLVADGLIRTAADVGDMLEGLLLDRLARADLPVLLAVHALATSSSPDDQAPVERIAEHDRRLDAVKLAREEREGSTRVGRRLLLEGARLFDHGALHGYADAVQAGAAPGHSAVAQGLVLAAAGVGRRAAALAAAASLASGVVTAAIRLGRIGHGDAQRLLLGAHPVIVAAVDRAEATDATDLRPSAPLLDIAIARHECADVRAYAS